LGHTLTGELSEGVSGSYNQREALAAAPQKPRFHDRSPSSAHSWNRCQHRHLQRRLRYSTFPHALPQSGPAGYRLVED